MNNFQTPPKAIKVSVVRIQEVFEMENSFTPVRPGVIKDYLYSPEKRVIA